jgi:cytochrome c peroxidase
VRLGAAVACAVAAAAGPAAALSGISSAALPAPVVDADYYDDGAPSPEKVELGRLLFFDKILSGNRNISCATCHHPAHATSDGLALPLGKGPRGLGPQRRTGPTLAEAVHARVPRNSTGLFNVGAREYTRFFHDGRVETDPDGHYEGGFVTPARWKLPKGLDNVLAAQAMFPVTSPAEMAGNRGENPVADAVALANVAGPGGVWEQLAVRLRNVPEYVRRFRSAFPDEIAAAGDITFVHAADAIAAFEATAFRADESAFDRWIRGDGRALTPDQLRGAELFYGRARCSGCHSGKFQTDHDFHAIAVPQIGPGKGDGRDGRYWRASGEEAFLEDFGRGRVTVRPEDRYRFRTPSLRNVALTGPWGHDGAYRTLEEMVLHHADPVAALEAYEPAEDLLPPVGAVIELAAADDALRQRTLDDGRLAAFGMRDTWVQRTPELRRRIAEANELVPVALAGRDVADLVAFLHTLTDSGRIARPGLVPDGVPSGLPVAD